MFWRKDNTKNMTNIIAIVAVLLAGMILMICHEISKELMYNFLNKTRKLDKKIFRIYQYIDPIGLLFCLILNTGFSKPYTQVIRGKKENLLTAITGYCTLFFLTALGLFASRIFNQFSFIQYTYWKFFIYMFLQAISVLGASMFLVNLYPLPTFNMGLIIAGKSPPKYVTLLYSDYKIKCLFIMFLIIRIIPTCSEYLYQWIAWK